MNFILYVLQIYGNSIEECTGEDEFWDKERDVCKICTRCSKGMQSTAVSFFHWANALKCIYVEDPK